MKKLKNILFIFSIILGTIGMLGLSYLYYKGFNNYAIIFIVCQVISIIFSWCFVYLEYKEKGYFKKGRKKNG